MKLERRAAAVLGVVAVLAAPAAILRVLCIGQACDTDQKAARKVPFCSLPARTRDAIQAGYREGRSPDILAVTDSGTRLVSQGTDPGGAGWPSLAERSPSAPVIFIGSGIPEGARIDEFGLDDIAPSLARVMDFDVPHPEVRSGRAVVGVEGSDPHLVVQIVLRGLQEAHDPVLDALGDRGASGRADLGSLPLDPAALMTTIGTGGVPAEHGITGSLLRNERALIAEAWTPAKLSRTGKTPPRSVIATLADDLDETSRQRARIGLVADTHHARGLVGGNWYVDNDRDSSTIVPTGRVVPAFRAMLRSGFGADAVPDLIGVSLRTSETEGATPALHLLRLLEQELGNGFTAVIVGLPGVEEGPSTSQGRSVADRINGALGHPVVEADTAGGLFLDQRTLADAGVTKDEVLGALEDQGSFADVFPGLAVAFARFC